MCPICLEIPPIAPPKKIKSLAILDKSPKVLKTGVIAHPLSYATLTFWPKMYDHLDFFQNCTQTALAKWLKLCDF